MRLKQILAPFERAWIVTILFRNGHSHVFHATSLKIREASDSIASLSWEGAVGAPFFFKASEVVLIQTRRFWRRRR